MQLRIRAKDYLQVKSQGQSAQAVEDNVNENEITPEVESVEVEVTVNNNGEQESEANPGSSQGPLHQGQGQETTSLNESNESESHVQPVCGFKMEKPKMPRFSGDVREYSIFRDDFKHAIESRYSKRDAMTYLRACLQGKPLELIKEIGND